MIFNQILYDRMHRPTKGCTFGYFVFGWPNYHFLANSYRNTNSVLPPDELSEFISTHI